MTTSFFDLREKIAKSLSSTELWQLLSDAGPGILLGVINYDEKMAVASTINDFLQKLSLDSIERKIIEEIFISKEVITQIILKDENSANLTLSREISVTEYEKINELLKELSIRIHIENGTYLRFYRLHPQEGNEWVLRKEKPNNTLKWYGIMLTDNAAPTNNEVLEEFIKLVKGSNSKSPLFDLGIRNVGVITHNKDLVLKTIQEFLDNFIAFKHTNKGLNFYIFDDSDDKDLEFRKNQIKNDIAIKYKPHGINVIYIGEEEKLNKIDEYEKTILSMPNLSISPLHIKKYINSALGLKGGVGSNRNWALLYDCLQIDDDVHPYTRLNIGSKTVCIPIDILSVINRGLVRPDSYGVNYEYCGARDGPTLRKLSLYLSCQEEPYPLSYHLDYLNIVKEDASLFTQCTYYDPHFFIPHGGVQIMLPTFSNAFVIPSPPKSENCLGVEDIIPSVLIEKLSLLKNSSIKRFYCPGGAIYHSPKFGIADRDMAMKAINEKIGFIFVLLLDKILEDEILTNAQLPEIINKEKEEAIKILGQKFCSSIIDGKLEKYFKLWVDGVLKPTFTFLGDTYQGFCSKIGILFELFEKYENLLSYPKEPKHLAIKGIEDVINEFSWKEFYIEWKRNKEKPDWKKLNLNKMYEIIKEELEIYAETLTIWPYLIKATLLFKSSG